jgi:hypothetical protein
MKTAVRTTNIERNLRVEDDPIVGLYEGSPDLSVRDEDILLSEIQTYSGWSCTQVRIIDMV